MATAAEIIENGLRKLGVIASGEDPSSAEQADGLTALNEMIESFSNESVFIFDDNEETFTLTASKAAYTMGPGGDFDTIRPIKINKARTRLTASSSNTELPMTILSLDEWARIVQKNTESNIARSIYIDYAYPLATVNVYPVPSSGQSLILNSMKVVQSFATAATAVSLPPGYNRMLTYNFAVEVAPEYGMEASPTVQRIATESKANLLRLNTQLPLAQNDIASLVNGASFNWLTGE